MKFDSYSMYSELTKNEVKINTDVADINQLIQDLDDFHEVKEVKQWLLNNWGIKDSISNYPISKNTQISTNNSNKYFNITVIQDNAVQSYNFKKGDLQ